MPDGPLEKLNTFDLLGQDGRVARTSRMIAEDERITSGRARDIIEQIRLFCRKQRMSQAAFAKMLGIKPGTLSPVLNGTYKGDPTKWLRKANNAMELAARRQNIIVDQNFVETSVAREILFVAEIIADTCSMGVIWGPARIGKSFTLKAIAGSDRFGNPQLFRVDEAHVRPRALCCLMCERLKLPTDKTFHVLARRLIAHLDGTKRMLMFDEAERCTYKTLEFIRDLHDQTGCPVLLCGKPAIYQKLGFREMGGYREVTDQLANRIVIRRDLTERTRDPKNGEPLFTTKDIRQLITVSNLGVRVAPDAVEWLRTRASVVSLGGIGMTKALLFLGCKLAFQLGMDVITVEVLERVEMDVVGGETVGDIVSVLDAQDAEKIRRLA